MKTTASASGVVLGTLLAATTVFANYDGAIWTTLGDGTEVNFNLYPSKESVYLNGGPGKGVTPIGGGDGPVRGKPGQGSGDGKARKPGKGASPSTPSQGHRTGLC